jgi:regulatory protein
MTPEAIATVQSDLKTTEFARAQVVWARKFSSKPSAFSRSSNTSSPMTQAEYAKQGRFLASRGFSMEVIHRVLKQTRSSGESIGDEIAEGEIAEVDAADVQMRKTRSISDLK